MAVKLQDLAKELSVSVSEIRDYIEFLDLKVPKSAQDVKDDLADLLREEIKKDLGDQTEEKKEAEGGEQEESVAEIYDEMIAEEKEREIRKSVKKIKGGKGQKKVARKKTEEKKEEVVESLGATSEQKVVAGTVEIGSTISVKEFPPGVKIEIDIIALQND